MYYWNSVCCVLLGMVFQVIAVLGYYVQWLSMYLLALVLQSSGWDGFLDHGLLTLDFLHIVWNCFPVIMYLFARVRFVAYRGEWLSGNWWYSVCWVLYWMVFQVYTGVRFLALGLPSRVWNDCRTLLQLNLIYNGVNLSTEIPDFLLTILI